MSIDMFQPRTMREALREAKPARSFLKNLFFRTSEAVDTEHVDVDVMVGARRLAPFVSTVGPGQAIDRIGYTSSSVTPPLLAPKRSVSIQDLQQRLPGEALYSGRSPESRLAEIVAADLAELDDLITRREEWMCKCALFDSAVVCTGKDVSTTISFTRDASLTKGLLAAASRWSASTADIPGQIRSWRRDVIKLTGATPDVLLCSSEAVDALLTNTGLTGTAGALSTLRMDLGQIKPELRESGATYIGSFAGTGIDIWAYDEWFIDPSDGTESPMIPAKKVLLGCTGAKTVMRYGAVPVKVGESIGLVADSRVPQSWVDDEPAVRWLKLSSRPLPVPIQNNAFLTAQVVA